MTPPDLLAFDGGAIKATANADGSVTLSGLAVVFDTPGSGRDAQGEFFTAETYFGAAAKSGTVSVDTLFHHGMPIAGHSKAEALADAILGEAEMTRTDAGWLASLVLPMREDYERDIATLAAAGKLGWSTGSASHTVRKTADGQITRWPLVEVSLTPTPAEPRTFAVPVKALAGLATKAEGESLNARLDRVHRAWYAVDGRGYIGEVFDDYAIAEIGNVYYRVPYTDDGAAVTFATAPEWVRVERSVSYDPMVKALRSARLSLRTDDAARLRAARLRMSDPLSL